MEMSIFKKGWEDLHQIQGHAMDLIRTGGRKHVSVN